MKPSIKTTIKVLKRERLKVAASRDRLRDIEDDIQGLRQDCDEAVDDLERAIDALSRLQ